MNSPTNNNMRDCVFCRDTVDSFGNYVSTYCHKHHTHILGFKDTTVDIPIEDIIANCMPAFSGLTKENLHEVRLAVKENDATPTGQTKP